MSYENTLSSVNCPSGLIVAHDNRADIGHTIQELRRPPSEENNENFQACDTINVIIRLERALNEVDKRDSFGKVVAQTDTEY